MIMKELGIKQSAYTHGFKRGVYFSQFYENTRDFLRGEVAEADLIRSKKLKNDIDSVMGWWVPKAIRRYQNLLESGRIKDDILYYNNGIGLTWDEFKSLYLGEVGR